MYLSEHILDSTFSELRNRNSLYACDMLPSVYIREPLLALRIGTSIHSTLDVVMSLPSSKCGWLRTFPVSTGVPVSGALYGEVVWCTSRHSSIEGHGSWSYGTSPGGALEHRVYLEPSVVGSACLPMQTRFG